MNRPSLAVRVTLRYMVIFAVAEFALAATMWFTVRGNVYDLVDNRFESQVDGLKRFLESRASGAALDKLKQDVEQRYKNQPEGDYLELSDQTGQLIYRSEYLQLHPDALIPADQVKRPQLKTRQIDSRPFRFLFQKFTVNGAAYTVELGQPAEDEVEMLHRLRGDLLRFGILFWLLATGAGYWITRRITAPESPPPGNSPAV
jgi:hypothetical protein